MPDEKPLTDLAEAPLGVDLKTDPAAILETGAALDELFKAAVPDPEKIAADEKAAADKVAADKLAADEKAKAAQPAQTDAEKAAAAAAEKEAADKAAAAAVKDDFEKVELPPHSKPATAQSFEALKKTAREKVAAAEKERDELKTQLAAAQAKPAVDPATEKELEELRQFRQKIDVEADPQFKEYVEEIGRNETSIFSKLKESGAGDEVLAKIKQIGLKDLNWEPVLEKLPPVARRYIENKLASNEDLEEQRTRAIDEAKKNASEFLATREKENLQNELSHRTAAEEHFGKVSVQLPWFKLQKAEANATPEQKAAIEAENKFFLATQKSVKEILADPSPNMRAISALGYAQMLRLQEEIPALTAEHAAEAKKLTDEITTLKTQLKEKEDFITRLKKSSTTSLRDGHASSNPNTAAKQPTFGEHGSTALDRLREEQTAGQ